MRELAHQFGGPFQIMYVLTMAPRTGQVGRYQLLGVLPGEQLDRWLDFFREPLEQDGRHNLWVRCGDIGHLVYDHHEVLYVYGDLELAERILVERGYELGECGSNFTHYHRCWEEFDPLVEYVVNSGNFQRYELVPDVDD